ncbi:MAG: mechanosensitive ion channel domain-containing protein [Cyanobacteriota bacterium]
MSPAAALPLERLLTAAGQGLLIALLVRLADRMLLRRIGPALARLGPSQDLAPLTWLEPILRSVLWLLGLLTWLQLQGLPFSTLLGALAGAGIGLGFALQGPARDLINTLTLLIDRPFGIGDRLRLEEGPVVVEGQVERLGLRCTELRSSDGSLVMVPHATLLQRPLRRRAATEPPRLTLPLHLDGGTDPEGLAAVPQLLAEALTPAADLVLESCRLVAIDRDRCRFELVLLLPDDGSSEPADARHRALLAVARQLRRHGLTLASPTTP